MLAARAGRGMSHPWLDPGQARVQPNLSWKGLLPARAVQSPFSDVVRSIGRPLVGQGPGMDRDTLSRLEAVPGPDGRCLR
jgi:hypothetical protein